MNTTRKIATVIAASLTLFAGTAAASGAMTRQATIHSAMHPVLAQPELCPDITKASIGAMFIGATDGYPTVIGINPNSPAGKAGLTNFDEVMQIGSIETTGRNNARINEALSEAMKSVEAGQSIPVTFRRGGSAVMTGTITPELICDVQFVSIAQPLPPSIQGQQVIVGSQMDGFMVDDASIRSVLSRYVAMVILSHEKDQKREGRGLALAGKAAEFVTGFSAPSARMIGKLTNGDRYDREADHMSVYLIARAGDDYTALPAFWEGVFGNQVKPTNKFKALAARAMNQSQGSPERLEGFKKSVEEVSALIAAGQPLVPATRLPGGEGEEAEDAQAEQAIAL